MKKVSRLLMIVGFICLAVSLLFHFFLSKKSCPIFVLGMTNVLIENLSFTLALVFFGGAGVLRGIDRRRNSEKLSAVFMSGGGILLALFMLIIITRGFESYSRLVVRKMKSPDSSHTIYYYKSRDALGDYSYRFYRRIGLIKYEFMFESSGEKENAAIEWNEDSLSFKGSEYEYSSYGE